LGCAAAGNGRGTAQVKVETETDVMPTRALTQQALGNNLGGYISGPTAWE
jgi:hypothetical protein